MMDGSFSSKAGHLVLPLPPPPFEASALVRAAAFYLFAKPPYMHRTREVVIKCKNLGGDFLNP